MPALARPSVPHPDKRRPASAGRQPRQAAGIASLGAHAVSHPPLFQTRRFRAPRFFDLGYPH
ncbi:hypothetical protein C0Z17_23825 [Trinickia caryophylli]|nr:hypothetical protein C0Z17_23825 [Trinickia caryophylli]